MKKLLLILVLSAPAMAATWFIRADGGTRYDATYVPTGQCDGKGDAAYPGSGTNQHCAFNQFPYLYDPGVSGSYAGEGWIISGGDTVAVRGCVGNNGCRLGWSAPTGGSNIWCYGAGNNACYNPPIPAGTSGAHTQILGACAYGTYTCNPANTYPYTSNLTQLFSGYGLVWALNLEATSYVDIEGIELTTHNAVTAGNPGYPSQCSQVANPYPQSCQNGSQPYDDFGDSGFLTNYQSSHLLFQDVYVHGFEASGFQGEIGGPITMTRVVDSMNLFAGWNFTGPDGDVADASGSQILATDVWMYGNGCFEQYPIVNTQFPAKGCWDSNSGGFGDGWSGQDTELDVFTCLRCVMLYNTKDAFIGPHTQIANLNIQNSVSMANMGAQWKWGATQNSTVLFQNNLTNTNCTRMQAIVPGAAYNFNLTTGNPGAELSLYCRGGGFGFATITRANGTNNFYGNTIIAGSGTGVFQLSCGYATSSVFVQETNCGTSAYILKDNSILGYLDPNSGGGGGNPTLYCALANDNSTCDGAYAASTGLTFTASYSNEYGISIGDTCSGTISCSNPLMLSQPTTPWCGSEACLDVYNPYTAGNSFYPSGTSPLIGAGTAISGLTADYYTTTRSNPPWLGAVNSLAPSTSSITITGSPGSISITGSASFTY